MVFFWRFRLLNVTGVSAIIGADRDAPRMSFREPPLQRGDVIPVQHHQTMLVVPSPVIVPQQDANAKFPMSYGAVIRAELMTREGGGIWCWYRKTLDGSFSAVSRPIFASEY